MVYYLNITHGLSVRVDIFFYLMSFSLVVACTVELKTENVSYEERENLSGRTERFTMIDQNKLLAFYRLL